MGKTFNDVMNEEHSGAVAFEYVIILVIMAVFIFTAWKILGNTLTEKAKDIANFIAGNGQSDLGTNGGAN